MNRLISRIIFGAAVSLLLAGGLPASANAQDPGQRETALCSELNRRQTEFSARLSALSDKFTVAKQQWLAKRAANIEKIDQRISSIRSTADEARNSSQQALFENQASEAHRAAAVNYASAVEDAVLNKRTAFDTARTEFRTAAGNLLAGYTAGTERAIETLQASATQAYAAAGQVCRSRKPDLAQARGNFVDSLKEARLNYDESRRNRQDFSAEIKLLIKTRDEAYEQAIAEFQRAMREAREAFAAVKADG